MIRSIVAFGLMFVMSSGAPASAAQQQPASVEVANEPEPQRADLSATVPAGMPVLIDNPHGNVFMRFGGYEHAVDIHSTLQQPADAAVLTLERGEESGRYVIAARLPKGATLAPTQRIDLAVYVAQGHAVSVRTTTGAIESRGLKSDLDLRSDNGDIIVRGTEGTVQAETGEGKIEVAMAGSAPAGSKQRLATTTGNITIGVTDQLDAKLRLATSALFSTDYSLDVTHTDGEEPNKWAQTTIGVPKSEILLESRQGEISLLRRAVYLEVAERPPQ